MGPPASDARPPRPQSGSFAGADEVDIAGIADLLNPSASPVGGRSPPGTDAAQSATSQSQREEVKRRIAEDAAAEEAAGGAGPPASDSVALARSEEGAFPAFGGQCAACGEKAADGRKLSTCTQCKHVCYCGRACQLAGWHRGHKDSCGRGSPMGPKALLAAAPAAVIPFVREFGSCSEAIADACLNRLAHLSLVARDASAVEATLRALTADPDAIGAVLSTWRAHQDCPSVRDAAYMLTCGLAMFDKAAANEVAQAGGVEPLVESLKQQLQRTKMAETGVRAIRALADSGPAAKEALCEWGAAAVVARAMDVHRDDVPILLQSIAALGNLTHRAGVEGRRSVVANQGIEQTCRAMRARAKLQQMQAFGCKALRNFVAGDESSSACGEAAEVAHDAMTSFPENGEIQEDACAVLANVASVGLAAERSNASNLAEALPAIVKALKRFPTLGSPRHALHVITASLGTHAPALEAGALPEWLPPKGAARTCSTRSNVPATAADALAAAAAAASGAESSGLSPTFGTRSENKARAAATAADARAAAAAADPALVDTLRSETFTTVSFGSPEKAKPRARRPSASKEDALAVRQPTRACTHQPSTRAHVA